MRNFRVLIVDDKKGTLDFLENNIGIDFVIADKEWKIKLETIYVYAENKTTITNEDHLGCTILDKTFENIKDNGYCKGPFDLFLFDFDYRQSNLDMNKVLGNLNCNDNVSIENYICNPKSLVQAWCKYKEENNYPQFAKSFQKNFIEHKKSIYIYTSIPEKWRQYFLPENNPDYIKNTVRESYKNAERVVVMDLLKDIFSEDEIKKNNHNELILKLLEMIIHYEIARKVIYLKE